MESVEACVARPELKGRHHTENIDNTSYAPDDIVFTERQMRKELIKHRAETGATQHVSYYRPAEWWDKLYYDNRAQYYEDKYGANASCSTGLFCVKCNNRNCGWRPEEIALFKNQVCPNCQALTIDLLAPPPSFSPKKRMKLSSTKLISLTDIKALRLTVEECA
jgi:hypothetical protein